MEVRLDIGPRPGRCSVDDRGAPRVAGRLTVLILGILGAVYVMANVVMTISAGF